MFLAGAAEDTTGPSASMPAECSPLKGAWVRPRSPRRLVTPDLGWAVRPSHPFGGRQCAPTGVCKVAQKNSDASCAQVLEEGDEPPVPPAAAQRPALLREMAGSRLGARPSAWRPGAPASPVRLFPEQHLPGQEVGFPSRPWG